MRALWTLLPFAVLCLCVGALFSCGGDDDDDDDDSGYGDDDDASSGPFDVTLNGTGFDVHEGQTMFAGVMNETTEEMLAVQDTVVTDGAFAFSFEGVLESGYEFHVHYFVDANENGMCDPAPDDHTWLIVLDDPTDDAVLDVTHNTDFTDDPDCDMFNEMMM